MKRLRIMKSYAVLWLFIYFLVYSNIETIKVFFFATLTFNLAVLTILTIGVIMLMKASINLVLLAGTFGTLAYKKENLLFYLKDIDKIMPANIAHMFNSRAEKGVMLFTAEESRDVIDWIEDKFFNQNRYTNYFMGTVLMIGLLGTFTGLLVAIDDMGRIILSLSGDINLAKVISDFSGPLGGMAVGFGSSLFGVVAAIILGIKGYILNKNQEVLIEGIEDWLKGRIINVASTAPVSISGDGNTLPEQQHSFMDVFIEQISNLTNEMAKITQSNERLHSITIASVQQARDEHELSVTIMENMQNSLKSIDAHSQEHAKALNHQFETLNSSIYTAQNTSEQSHIKELEKVFSRLETALQTSQNTISEELSKISSAHTKASQDNLNALNEALRNLDTHLEGNKQALSKLLDESSNSATTQETQLKQIATLLHNSSKTLTQEQATLQALQQQLHANDAHSSEQMQGLLTSLSTLSENLNMEIQQLVNMEDAQKAQHASIKQNTSILTSIADGVNGTQTETSHSLKELESIRADLSTMSTTLQQNTKEEILTISQHLQHLRQNIQEGQKQQSEAIQAQALQNDISAQGNSILNEILKDQKEQMKALVLSQEKMLVEQANLTTLSKEGIAQGNKSLEALHLQAIEALKEQQGFRKEHNLLLTLTQRSSELSEEAASLHSSKSDQNLEALERLINENQSIKAEIKRLSEVIKKKSFNNGDNNGFISKLFN